MPVDSPEELYSLAEQGGIDLAAGIPYDYDLARERHLSMTRPYISSQYLLMMKEGSSEETIKGKRLALTTTSPYRGETVGQVARYAKVADCIRAVESGEADYTYVDAYMAQYFINQPQFRDLKLSPRPTSRAGSATGWSNPRRQELLSILNKAILTLSTAEIQGVINRTPSKATLFLPGGPDGQPGGIGGGHRRRLAGGHRGSTALPAAACPGQPGGGSGAEKAFPRLRAGERILL